MSEEDDFIQFKNSTKKNLNGKIKVPEKYQKHLGKSGPVGPHCLQPKDAALRRS